MKLLGSSKSKIAKDENGEDVPNLEVVEVVLVHCSLIIMIISKNQEYYTLSFQTKHLVAY